MNESFENSVFFSEEIRTILLDSTDFFFFCWLFRFSTSRSDSDELISEAKLVEIFLCVDELWNVV